MVRGGGITYLSSGPEEFGKNVPGYNDTSLMPDEYKKLKHYQNELPNNNGHDYYKLIKYILKCTVKKPGRFWVIDTG